MKEKFKKIKNYIFSETDDACALCGQKGLQNLTEHHIDGEKKNNQYDNRIVLCRNCHCRFNEKKGITKNQIINVKRRLIIKTLTRFGINALKIAKRNNYGVAAIPFLLLHLVDLGFLKQKETISSYGDDKKGIVCDEALFEITEKGRKLVERWKL